MKNGVAPTELYTRNRVGKSYIDQGGNSQNFLRKFVRFFLTLKYFYRVIIHRK